MIGNICSTHKFNVPQDEYKQNMCITTDEDKRKLLKLNLISTSLNSIKELSKNGAVSILNHKNRRNSPNARIEEINETDNKILNTFNKLQELWQNTNSLCAKSHPVS